MINLLARLLLWAEDMIERFEETADTLLSKVEDRAEQIRDRRDEQ